jgi:hypothetical protein
MQPIAIAAVTADVLELWYETKRNETKRNETKDSREIRRPA